MTTLNLFLSIASLVGAVLVGRAFLPHIPLRGRTPAAYLAWAFVLASACYFPRTAYWDIVWVLQGGSISTAWLNALVNLGILAAEHCALRARWAAIPDHERHRWNIFTAIWYPERLRFPRLRCGD